MQKLNLATKLAKRFEGEKKDFQNRCEELFKEVEKMRELYSPASTSQNSTNNRGNMFPTKLELVILQCCIIDIDCRIFKVAPAHK